MPQTRHSPFQLAPTDPLQDTSELVSQTGDTSLKTCLRKAENTRGGRRGKGGGSALDGADVPRGTVVHGGPVTEQMKRKGRSSRDEPLRFIHNYNCPFTACCLTEGTECNLQPLSWVKLTTLFLFQSIRLLACSFFIFSSPDLLRLKGKHLGGKLAASCGQATATCNCLCHSECYLYTSAASDS